jgi:hypothetical protein
MEGGHDDLSRRPLLCGMLVDRNAPPVVFDGDTVVLVDGDVDLFAETANGFVDRVVHDLVDEVVKTRGTCGPDIHRRPLADRIESFENLDGTGVVAH